IAAVMVGGGLLSWLVVIPLLDWWGASRSLPLYPETVLLMTDMSPSQLWSRYVRYIGAGAVATAGIITLVRSLPVMVDSFRIGFGQLQKQRAEHPVAVPRTGQDLPLKVVGIGAVLVIATLGLVPV